MSKLKCKAKPKSWSNAEEDLLAELYPTAKDNDLVEVFQRSACAIKSRATFLGILKFNGHAPWTIEDDALLVKLYPNTLTAEIADKLGRSISALNGRATKLKLCKSLEYMQQLAANSKLHLTGVAFRYPKGHVPANKGVKGINYPGMEKTQFKKGDRPHTWKPIGTIRINKDNYLQVKLSDTGYPPRDWRGVHIVIWERLHGISLTKGHMVSFRDKDKRNFEPENLELISLAENMMRNTYHNYGKEIARAYQLKGQITRQINKRERQKNE